MGTSSQSITFCQFCSTLTTTLGWLPELSSYEVSGIDATEDVLEKIVKYFKRRYVIEEAGEAQGKDVRSDLQGWDSEFLEEVDDAMLFDLVRVRH